MFCWGSGPYAVAPITNRQGMGIMTGIIAHTTMVTTALTIIGGRDFTDIMEVITATTTIMIITMGITGLKLTAPQGACMGPIMVEGVGTLEGLDTEGVDMQAEAGMAVAADTAAQEAADIVDDPCVILRAPFQPQPRGELQHFQGFGARL